MSWPQLYKQGMIVFWKVFPIEEERLAGCENIINVQFGYA